MRQLALLPGATLGVDATPPIQGVVQRMERLLAQKIYRVHSSAANEHFASEAARVEGMEHLAATLSEAAGFSSMPEALRYAKERGIVVAAEGDALSRLQRLAASERKNQNMVHPSVPAEWRHQYY